MSVVYFFAYSLVVTTAFFLSPFLTKVRRGLFGRLGVNRRVRKHASAWAERPFWFHAASSGELEQCLPILDRLKEMRPDIPIFLSYFSPTGQTALALETERRKSRAAATCNVPWDYSDYSPFDFPWSTRSFVRWLNPRAFIAINREVWPGMLSACASRNIPRYLFAAYFSPKSRKSVGIYRRWLLSFGYIGVTEPSTAQFLADELEARRVEVIGDPRIERVLARRKTTATSRGRLISRDRAASSWQAFGQRISGPSSPRSPKPRAAFPNGDSFSSPMKLQKVHSRNHGLARRKPFKSTALVGVDR